MDTGDHKRSCGAGAIGSVGRLLGVCLLATMMGCASQSKKSPAPVDYARQMQRMKKQKLKRQRLEDLKERKLVLEQRNAAKAKAKALADANRPASIMYTEDTIPRDVASATSAPETMPAEESVSIPAGVNAEHFLYSKIIDTYRGHDFEQMKTTLRLLLRTYPDSIFADNALYMAGLLSLETRDLKEAKSYFERVVEEYPQSNKVVSALFMIAAVDKQSGKHSAAIAGFKRVRDLFPGSPEAFRVSVELKLLGQTTSKRRET